MHLAQLLPFAYASSAAVGVDDFAVRRCMGSSSSVKLWETQASFFLVPSYNPPQYTIDNVDECLALPRPEPES